MYYQQRATEEILNGHRKRLLFVSVTFCNIRSIDKRQVIDVEVYILKLWVSYCYISQFFWFKSQQQRLDRSAFTLNMVVFNNLQYNHGGMHCSNKPHLVLVSFYLILKSLFCAIGILQEFLTLTHCILDTEFRCGHVMWHKVDKVSLCTFRTAKSINFLCALTANQNFMTW